VLDIIKGVYDYIFAHPGTIFADELQDHLLLTFGDTGENFICGPIVSDTTSHSAPEWVQWSNKTISGLGGNQLKVWFNDTAFQAQYDDFEIVVVPPLVGLNNFFKTPVEVKAALAAETPVTTMNRVQTAKAGYPETVIRAESFDWINPFDAADKVSTSWHVLIYGEAGNNPDAISDALVAYALANSGYTRPQWVNIMPDMFRRTEFVLVPMWDQYAIGNYVVESGIYSPVVNLKRAIALIKSVINDTVNYPLAHIDDHLQLMAHPYKSLQILSVGNPLNRDSLTELTDVYPDILAISTTSIDFNRMEVATKNFLTALGEMIPAAEELTLYTSAPAGMSKSVRAGKLYLVKRVNNIDYLLLAKSQLVTVIEGV
jgi:hypothetical protein